jgi:hypothetical protein
MGGIYLDWLADELRAAGGNVVEYDTQWKRRARSSGGFAAQPLGVSFHHTAGASGASAKSECDYMCVAAGNSNKPTANIYIARDGTIWVLAAGATNTSGKGGPLTLSRGTVGTDCANTTTVGMEMGNNGVGEPWPEVQIDAAFLASNAINRRLGNQPTDVFSHNLYAPSRKIDPATAAAVQGPWKPRSCTSSGTWSTDDIRAECARRATTTPTPPAPTPEEDDDMATVPAIWRMDNDNAPFAVYMNGQSPLGYKVWLPSGMYQAFQNLCKINGWSTMVNIQTDPNMFKAFGPVLGPIPAGHDQWGLPT